MKLKFSFSFALALALAAFGLAPAVCHASSFTQEFNEDYGAGSNSPFDTVDVFIENSAGVGVTFANPGITFGTAGETDVNVNPGFSSVTGPTIGFLDFYTNVVGNTTSPFTFDLYAFNNGKLVDSDSLTYNGVGGANYGFTDNGALSIGAFGAENMAPSSVTPEPSSLILLGTGLLGAAGVARKRFTTQ